MTNEKNEPTKYPHLERIDSPKDLKDLTPDELTALAGEIRELLVERVTENGGHLASNLGVVELSIALHRVFDCPHDHVIFDVGHQSYVHKILTGRRARFSTLRRGGGISGFPKREESEYDCFGTGHSSTSLSAALGFAEADKLSGSDAYTVCVLGDGAYTGGMIHEALNNCRKNLRLIIVLNENEMSISKNIGRFAKNLSNLRSKKGYFRTKNATTSFLRKIPLIGKPLFNFLKKIKMGIKAILYGSNYFENLGLYYLGPADGNDEAAVEVLLREAKASKQSCVIHLKTKKGKGYAPAESTPDRFHGMAPANCPKPEGTCFSEEMGRALCEIAAKDERVLAVTAAMAGGTGLVRFGKAYPHRFFDVGIAEEHAVTFAAGLAANGFRPVAAIYSTFLQRAYDNVIHDVALQNLPVVFCVDRAGLNASDGPTHHGIYDVAFLSQIPNMTIYAPVTREGLCRMLAAALKSDGPVAIRYPNGTEDERLTRAFYPEHENPKTGVRSLLGTAAAKTADAVIVTYGRIAAEALDAAESLKKTDGITVNVLLLEQIKPYERAAEEVARLLPEKGCPVVFLEEAIRAGGMGMMLSDALRAHPVFANKKTAVLAIGNGFVSRSGEASILCDAGLDSASVVRTIRSLEN